MLNPPNISVLNALEDSLLKNPTTVDPEATIDLAKKMSLLKHKDVLI